MLQPGDTLLQYRLVARIGEGGMGVVWRATDTSLDRDVALKFLPEGLGADPERVARLEREARLLAALSHPRIAAVHGLHEHRGLRFLAMEWVPGADLARTLARGPLPTDEALAAASDIADALAAAHDAGVVHRDLKPANVVRLPDGRIKVLDFGLAKALDPASPVSGTPTAGNPAASPTITSLGTAAGVILGTAAYMSPEQARGRPVDRRADLWAFGSVLYEMLAGRAAFLGETVSDTLAAVLRGEPAWDALAPDTPPAVRDLLARCLAKDPAARWRDAGDARLVLDTARAATAAGDAPSRWPPRRTRMWGGLAAAGVLVAALAGWSARAPGPTPAPREIRSSIEIPPGWQPQQVRISPDGRTVAMMVSPLRPDDGQDWRVLLRRLDAWDERWVQTTLEDDVLRFSPDSTQIALVLRDVAGIPGASLARMPSDGSAPPIAIAPWSERYDGRFVWLGDGTIAVVDLDPPRLVRLPVDGRRSPEPVQLRLPEGAERFLVHSEWPGGRILGSVESWVGGYHQDAAVLDPATGVVERLIDRAVEPALVPPDRLLFSRGSALLAVAVDVAARRTTGAPHVVENGLAATIELTSAMFSISDAGDLAYVPGGMRGSDRRLVWLRPDGTREPWGPARDPFAEWIDDSADGNVVAWVRVGPEGLYEIRASRVDEPAPRTVLGLPAMDCLAPSVSPDGTWIAATCFGDRERGGTYLIPFHEPRAEPRRILAAERGPEVREIAGAFSPDGRTLFLEAGRAYDRAPRALAIGADGEVTGEPQPVPGIPDDVRRLAVSPDGRFIAMTAPHGTGHELRLASWNGREAASYRVVATARSAGVEWTGDGRARPQRLFYLDPEGRWLTVAVGPDGRPGTPEPVPALRDRPFGVFGLAPLSDGRILAIELGPSETEARAPRLVTGFAHRLR